MSIHESNESHRALELHNEVMGIRLAIRPCNDDYHIFRMIDNALMAFNIGEMRKVGIAFNMLPDVMQREIRAGEKTTETIAAVARFTRHLRQLMNKEQEHPARSPQALGPGAGEGLPSKVRGSSAETVRVAR